MVWWICKSCFCFDSVCSVLLPTRILLAWPRPRPSPKAKRPGKAFLVINIWHHSETEHFSNVAYTIHDLLSTCKNTNDTCSPRTAVVIRPFSWPWLLQDQHRLPWLLLWLWRHLASEYLPTASVNMSQDIQAAVFDELIDNLELVVNQLRGQ